MNKNTLKYAAVFTAVVGLTGIAAAASGKAEPVYAGGGDSAEGTLTVAAESDESELIYCVGSVSKIYVTAAALRLADEGKLDIDAPVSAYIPEFTMADERYGQITLRMLMDHTSGIMGTTETGGFLMDDNKMAHHDSLLGTLAGQRLKADPGAYAAYCNDGFDLLEQVVERVSGMSYTEYVKSVLAAQTGGKNTGTPVDLCRAAALVPAYNADGLLYDNTMTMCFGAGGVYATASDVASFGAAFFKGNDSLLSEQAKEAMAERWDKGADIYHDRNGLGWDYVSMEKYEEKGISVVAKGGDSDMNHAWLMVAPEEEISVAVLSNGGSSTLNALMATAVMDVILSERGIETGEIEKEQYETLAEIPGEYERFEGIYLVQNDMGDGAEICRISFPDHKYLHSEYYGARRRSVTDYKLTTEGSFAELAYPVEDGDPAEVKLAMNPTVMEFISGENGRDYIAAKMVQSFPGMGDSERATYVGERLDENPLDADVMNVWLSCCNRDLLLCNDVWSSNAYNSAFTRLYASEQMSGYLYAVMGRGSRLLKIVDEKTLIAPSTIPSSTNRDITDAKLYAGEEGIRLSTGTGMEYRLKEDIPYLGTDLKEVALKDRDASWYRIGTDMAGGSLMLEERPEHSAVYVYNKYGDVVYNSHVRDAGDELPLPEEGLILFLGESGSIKFR